MTELERKLNKVIDTFKDAKPGVVTHVFIKHDADCPALVTQNLADCNCDPEINKGNDNDITRL